MPIHYTPIAHAAGRRLRPGVTLIEAVVALGIISLIALVVGAFQRDIFLVSGFLQDSLLAQQDLRRTLKAFSAEARSLSPSGAGAYPIAAANPNDFAFYSDTDSDGLRERIRYFLDGTNLKKGVIVPGGAPAVYDPANETVATVIRNVISTTTPIFEYYDTTYNGVSPPLSQPVDTLAIRLVKVTVTVDRNPSRPPPPVTLTTQISLRNLKDNL
ncbi:MAG: hypothetical protein HY473_02220 [Candidatus Sungbacteria bacterium]|uniref:Prepilin-type N-terminal cleavage/methylation domain-containing protein n=1 Tax=Candidatus Sungiibacteriota bacterium TaxID=2750080 RepID=A0A932YYZ8_9BACT|nr:hypothetical protein [Candidatus Sungbacteria bacterium]